MSCLFVLLYLQKDEQVSTTKNTHIHIKRLYKERKRQLRCFVRSVDKKLEKIK